MPNAAPYILILAIASARSLRFALVSVPPAEQLGFLAPVLLPPCIRHTALPLTAIAPHWLPCLLDRA